MKKYVFLGIACLIMYGCYSKNNMIHSEPVSATSLTEFENHIFAGSGNCAQCHSNLISSKGEDVSIDSDWRSTMMANSAKDPLWQAKVHTETLRNPSISDAIEQKCSKCHMPMANVEANHEGDLVKIFGENGFLKIDNKYHKMAMDGVSCTVCHQIQNDNLGTESSFTGGFIMDLQTSKPDRQIFGQYTDPLQRPMRMNVGYTPVYGSHIESSELCATCHTLFTNPVDDYSRKFPEQTPYLEWKNSIYGDGQGSDDKSCQQCHMPQADGTVKISNRPSNMISERNNFAKHYFVGGNVFMLNILKNNISKLGLTANQEHFNKTILRTKEILKNSAKITIGNIAIDTTSNTLIIPITVENLTGHKLPSGYPARRVWIHLKVIDANGNVVFESGKSDKDGKIIGNDADFDETKFEPHYDVITSENQVQIYEPIMEDINGNITYTLMKAYDYAKDNRLLPKGFDKTNASADIAVKGNALNDSNFSGGQDSITYNIDINGYYPPFTITAELKYQSVSYRFFQDLLKDKNNSTYVSLFEELYLQEDNSGYIIDTNTKVIN